MNIQSTTLTICLFAASILSCEKQSELFENFPQKEIQSIDNHFVSLDKVTAYAMSRFQDTKTITESPLSIFPYCSSEGDTLLYIVNYPDNKGWQIISSDTRTPAIIAEGESGHFSTEEGAPAVQVWLECTAADLNEIRHSSDSALNFSEDEINANNTFWSNNVVQVVPKPDDGEGYWATTTTSEYMICETVEHMTPKWDQDYPYNAYCPRKTDGSDENASAGCVAIAASGVLLYLHDLWGTPSTMVTAGYCNGNITNYSSWFGNSSPSAWLSMSYDYHTTLADTDAEALMIGYVGSVINMHYHNGYSWALPRNIRTDLMNQFGISCSQGGYDASIVQTNLMNHKPVIVTASDLLIPIPEFNIHCFVIDGFMKCQTKYTHYHYWVSNNDNPWIIKSHINDHTPYYTYTYSSPSVTRIKINWGWRSQWSETNPVNDGWYSLTADWTVTNDGTYDYNHNVNMIYDFSI